MKGRSSRNPKTKASQFLTLRFSRSNELTYLRYLKALELSYYTLSIRNYLPSLRCDASTYLSLSYAGEEFAKARRGGERSGS